MTEKLKYDVQWMQHMCLVLFCMPIKLGKAWAGTSTKPWDVFYDRKVSTVAFLERIKVYDVKLADVNRSDTDIGVGLWR